MVNFRNTILQTFDVWKKQDVQIAACCVFVFLVPSLVKVFIQDYPIDNLIIGIDDWNRYARHAIDIKQHGLLIVNVDGPYLIPAGFLYNYFVAGVFLLFGDYPAVVYIIQSMLLGISVAMTYFLFREKLKPKTGYVLLTLLILFAFLDIYKNYTFRLFSENLAIFTITLFFFLLKKTLNTISWRWQFLVGLTLGASVLIRPNLLPFSLVFILIFHLPKIIRKEHFTRSIAFLIGFVVILMMLPLRNYLAAGNLTLMPVDGTFMDYMHRINPISFTENPIEYLSVYFEKILYCFGDIPILNPDFHIRPHWFLMWAGFFYYLIHLIRFPRQRDSLMGAFILYVFAFYLTLILIAQISVYGHRMFIPGIFIVLGVSVVGYERALTLLKARFPK
jgi:hypothetical protein